MLYNLLFGIIAFFKECGENNYFCNDILLVKFHYYEPLSNMQALSELNEVYLSYAAKQNFPGQPDALYEPVRYIMSLGGKRLRPLLSLAACRIFDPQWEKALPVAYAVELFHNFSLVHDDIMDQAPLRRGKPTVHEKFGQNTAILSGDVMLVKVYGYLAEAPGSRLAELLGIFNQTATGVCEGQQMDMLFESRGDVTVAEYIRMIELKTAVLLAGALEMGALVGGANPTDAGRLAEFGRKIGIAFQIKDDLLDSFGDPEKFGKKIGGDIAQNKKTYLVCKAFEIATPAQRADLLRFMAYPPAEEAAKIDAVKAFFSALGLPELAAAAIDALYREAIDDLRAVEAGDAAKAPLAAFAAELMEREH